jgi:hypothetical protein
VSEIYQWVIYENPSDFPGKLVVRQWRIDARGLQVDLDPTAVVDTLEAARAVVPEGAYRLDPMPEDDPVIVEVWT